MKRVLCVDDDPDIRSLLRLILEDEGHEVHEAGNGVEGTKLAQGLLPDLILLDVVMPLADGFTVCKILKGNKATAHIPILMLTTRSERAAVEVGLAAGADDYAVKPIQMRDLARRVHCLLAADQLCSLADPQDSQAVRMSKTLSRPTELALVIGGAGAIQGMQQIAGAMAKAPRCPLVVLLQLPSFASRFHAAQFGKGGRVPFQAGVKGDVLLSGTCYLLPDDGPVLRVCSVGGKLMLLEAEPEPEPDHSVDLPEGVSLADEVMAAELAATGKTHSVRTRADVLLDSAVATTAAATLAMVLSGSLQVGGAKGLDRLRAVGGETYAQSDRAAIVPDLPRRMLELGAAEAALDLGEMAVALCR